MALKIVVTKRGPAALMVLHGALDEDSVRVLRLKAQSILATGHPHLVLDLADVVVDPAGMNMLGYVMRIFSLASGTVALRGCDLDLEAELLALEVALADHAA